MSEEFDLDPVSNGEPWRTLSGEWHKESCASGDPGSRMSSAPSGALMPLYVKPGGCTRRSGRSSSALSFWDQSLSRLSKRLILPAPSPFKFFCHSVLCCGWNRPLGGLSAEWSLCLGSNSVLFSFFLSLWNLQGEKPNLCRLQGEATWKGAGNNEMGNPIPSGFQSGGCSLAPARAASCQRDLTLSRPSCWRAPARPAWRLQLVVWTGGGFSVPSKSSAVVTMWVRSFSFKIENVGSWLCPGMEEGSSCSISDK